MVALGNVAVETVREWRPDPGRVVSWDPSPAALEKARQAPVSSVPVSYMQAQHLRGFVEHAARGQEMSRLCIAAFDIPGRCDLRAMTYVINAHMRRHDTYRSWFEYHDFHHIVRHTITDPADIELVPTRHGAMTPEQWQQHLLSTPDPLQWNCFRFSIIQRSDHFTFCVCMDHVHIDAMFMGAVFMEIHMQYAALVGGGAPIPLQAGSYDDFCVRQRQYTESLTADSPEVRAWVDFAGQMGGTLPNFPLPLGDRTKPWPGELMVVKLLDGRQTDRFEAACVSAGARFVGGVFACAALTENELAGVETFHAITPTDTRSTPADFMTTGWFTGMVPITVPAAGVSFGEAARAAQQSFDSGIGLGHVPYDRVLELVPSLRRAETCSPMMSFLDAGVPPLSALVASQLDGLNARVYGDGKVPAQLCMWVNRMDNETSVTVFFPDNPVARASVEKYVATLRSIYVAVAEGRADRLGARRSGELQRQPA
ncbi:condensation domain-containing protein [Mycolicibacterium thermoresistibile]|jgi:hypothetical protein|uniref:Condensation domain-containing protein n=1 Tax=Mycolicibacterium thermoresistibile TaxID=1797 RepID=A0A117INS8_MYCTH|nr:condensation domain-containing protein [Mycolicibacterium thermoresistibile]MCV7188502.1 acyltransferase [Mycolicibacterium thermoresistibile]GAT17411.1 putative uncharacterized protein [Mycolicibacterium thermoresistibile]SNW18167.1 condensation domain-containing protein [Mycolicibacterium thermoresistibile]